MEIAGVDWSLDVDYREKNFRGVVAIHVDHAADPLVVDVSHLTIHSTTMDGAPAPYKANPTSGTLEFSAIPDGPHVIEISYQGVAAPDSLVGMYVAPAGSRYVLTTMLFPTGAGRVLPAFEHPAVKTVYRLTLTVDAELEAVFNTAVRSERRVGDRRELTFEATPVMSAYLLYLGIGPFEKFRAEGGRWAVTVITSPGRATAGRYSAERASEILAAYEEYYGIPYPLPKLDLIALENFWAGAMENWGAIAFRESQLLVDPSTSIGLRRGVLATLAHEIAHQWFGDLVTAAWWDDFWLNESFATFVGYRIVERHYPEEDAWTQFLIRWVDPALEMDSLVSTHPVHVPVDNPDSLGENADHVTYGKGAAVLWMIESYLGEDRFRRGVSRYLSKHQYSNARAEDLWTALSEVSGEPVGRVMSEWINRPGYPVVDVDWTPGRLTLHQERFRADGTPTPGIWPIPLRVQTADGPTTLLFESAERSVPVASLKGLRVNPGRTAFVRVHYAPSVLEQVVTDFLSMDPIDQWGLVADTHAFVYAGRASVEELLALVRTATGLEVDLPVRGIVSALSDLGGPLHDHPPFLDAMRKFLRAQVARIGVDPVPNEPEARGAVREILTGRLAEVDLDFARSLAPRYSEFDHLPPALRSPVSRAYARVGGADAFDPILARLRAATSEGDRTHMLMALSSFDRPELLRRSLELVFGPDVESSNVYSLLVFLSRNPEGGGTLFDWYRDHATQLSEKWAGTPLLSLFLKVAIPGMGRDREDKAVRYFSQHTPPEATQGISLGVEALHLEMRLRRKVLGTSTDGVRGR